jgi:hypothetical protein
MLNRPRGKTCSFREGGAAPTGRGIWAVVPFQASASRRKPSLYCAAPLAHFGAWPEDIRRLWENGMASGYSPMPSRFWSAALPLQGRALRRLFLSRLAPHGASLRFVAFRRWRISEPSRRKSDDSVKNWMAIGYSPGTRGRFNGQREGDLPASVAPNEMSLKALSSAQTSDGYNPETVGRFKAQCDVGSSPSGAQHLTEKEI